LLSPTSIRIIRICLHPSASIRIVSSSREGACPTDCGSTPYGEPRVFLIYYTRI